METTHMNHGNSVVPSEQRISHLSFKSSDQVTYVDCVKVVLVKRCTHGSIKLMPYFKVTTTDNETKLVSICKYGWRSAWRKALLSKVAIDGGKRHFTRFLNRPPKLIEFVN